MKVLIADKFPSEYVKEIGSLPDVEVAFSPELKAEDLVDAAKDANILIVRSTKVLTDTIKNAHDLGLIIRAGAGFDTIDVKTASKLGLYVANCPGKNSAAVAELAMGLILSIDRRIPDNVAELRDKKWNKKEYSKADGLQGKTLGIVGLGKIAKELVMRAKGFGLNIIAWSRSLTPEKAETLGIGFCADPLELAQKAHIYNQRTGAYLGHLAAVRLKLDPTSATILSLLPYRVGGIEAHGPQRVAQGASARLRFTVQSGQGTKTAGHVLRVKLINPAGKQLWLGARTLRGRGECAVPFAFNDAPGTWTVLARDVATRAEAHVRLLVVAPSE